MNLKRGLEGLILACQHEAIDRLPITNDHLLAYDQVPFFDAHRDPFDRLILATALAEGMPLISADEKFSRYQDLVDVIWETAFRYHIGPQILTRARISLSAPR